MAAPDTQAGKDKQRRSMIRNYPAAAKKMYAKGSPYGELTADETRNRITKTKRSTSDGYMPNKTRKLEVKSIGGEMRGKATRVQKVLTKDQKPGAELNRELKKGDVKVKQRTAQ